MVYLDKEKTFKCNHCQYLLPRVLDAVADVKLVAGLGEGSEKPYSKTVSFHRRLKIQPKTEVYNNPMDAWNEM
jgi:hypothetical protein